MTHMAQGVGSGMGASKGQGWAHRTLVWVSVLMFVLWALSVSWVHAKPKAPPSPLPQLTHLGKAGPGNGTLVLKQGASGVLQATLSPTPTAPGVLTVSSDAPATVSVPATITFAPSFANRRATVCPMFPSDAAPRMTAVLPCNCPITRLLSEPE